MRRLLRYLRIAFSLTCGIAAVLLCVLWVRSFWRVDDLARFQRGTMYLIESADGSLRLVYERASGGPNLWHYDSEPMDAEQFAHPVFGWDGTDFPKYCMLYLPHWLPAIVIALLAALPWIRWSSRFSLRTLLIATTLVALVLGLIIWFRRAS